MRHGSDGRKGPARRQPKQLHFCLGWRTRHIVRRTYGETTQMRADDFARKIVAKIAFRRSVDRAGDGSFPAETVERRVDLVSGTACEPSVSCVQLTLHQRLILLKMSHNVQLCRSCVNRSASAIIAG
jgi:hypothetical protein